MTPAQIKQARQSLCFSQQALADKMGIKVSKLRNWEQGRNEISDEGATAISWLLAGRIL